VLASTSQRPAATSSNGNKPSGGGVRSPEREPLELLSAVIEWSGDQSKGKQSDMQEMLEKMKIEKEKTEELLKDKDEVLKAKEEVLEILDQEQESFKLSLRSSSPP
ncbi:hypothetical protein Dimus_020033, partial [Dionaea muscipula]